MATWQALAAPGVSGVNGNRWFFLMDNGTGGSVSPTQPFGPTIPEGHYISALNSVTVVGRCNSLGAAAKVMFRNRFRTGVPGSFTCSHPAHTYAAGTYEYCLPQMTGPTSGTGITPADGDITVTWAPDDPTAFAEWLLDHRQIDEVQLPNVFLSGANAGFTAPMTASNTVVSVAMDYTTAPIPYSLVWDAVTPTDDVVIDHDTTNWYLGTGAPTPRPLASMVPLTRIRQVAIEAAPGPATSTPWEVDVRLTERGMVPLARDPDVLAAFVSPGDLTRVEIETDTTGDPILWTPLQREQPVGQILYSLGADNDAGNTTDLHRITVWFRPGPQLPTAVLTATPDTGAGTFPVDLDGTASHPPADHYGWATTAITSHKWDIQSAVSGPETITNPGPPGTLTRTFGYGGPNWATLTVYITGTAYGAPFTVSHQTTVSIDATEPPAVTNRWTVGAIGSG